MPNASDGYVGVDCARLEALFSSKFSKWGVGGWRERKDLVQEALLGALLACPEYQEGPRSLVAFLFERGYWYALNSLDQYRGLDEDTRRLKENFNHPVSLNDPAYAEKTNGKRVCFPNEVLDENARTPEQIFYWKEEEKRLLGRLRALLSPLEMEVYLLLDEGHLVKEIADALMISRTTVYTCRRRAREKLSPNYEGG